MKNILITGGAGFIGTNFVINWLKKYKNDNLIIIDKLTYSGKRKNIQNLIKDKKIIFYKGDINSNYIIDKIFKNHQINIVVNFAAESHVDNSIINPDHFIESNIFGTYNLLKASKKFWIDKKIVKNHLFHHVSTDEIYGSLTLKEKSFTESSIILPNSPYSASKASSNHLVRAYNKTYGLKTSISNCSNNYGCFQNIEKLIPKTISNILMCRSIPIYGKGKQIRDWMHVDDHCNAILKIIKSNKAGSNYNIGGNNEISNIDLVHLICSIIDQLILEKNYLFKKFKLINKKNFKSSNLIKFVNDRPGHDFRYSINSSKLKKELNFSPQISFKSGLYNTIIWYIENFDWWK